MSATISIALLQRFLQATPEQLAAMGRYLGVNEADGMRREEGGVVSAEVARQAFALLQKLELDAPLKPPSVLTVFRLYCMDGYSADRVARKCRCAKGTVMSRLRFIEVVTHTRPEQFRAQSAHLQQMHEDLNDSVRAIYRRGLANEGVG